MDLKYKVILINLEKDKDRLEFMERQFQNLDLQFDRFTAVNGKEYIENGGVYNKDLSIKYFGSGLTLGEVGCALSHNLVYKKFLEDKYYQDTKYLLILEDDIELDKKFKHILERATKKNEEKYKWNYLQFNYYEVSNLKILFSLFFKKFKWNYIILKKTKNLKHKIINFVKIFINPFLSLCTDSRMYILSKFIGIYKTFPKNPMLAGAYFIDKEIAKDLYEINNNIIYPADIVTSREIYKNNKYKFCFYTPLIAKQKDNILSSIDNMELR